MPSSSIKSAYAASAAFTITLASLASSSTLVAGRESTAVSNASNLYLDFFVGGKISPTLGSPSPTSGGLIDLWAYASLNDTPLYPDAVTGSDAAITFTSREILISSMRRLWTAAITASAVSYWIPPISLRETFGFCPRNFGVVVVHSTGQPLSSSSGDHALYYTPMYNTVG